MICSACGASVPERARYCPSCGHGQSRGAEDPPRGADDPSVHTGDATRRAEERRVATVVFVDIVGFTHLAESADPEQVKNLVDVCFERLARDVASFGGTVDKVVGDALVALFGAPLAHGDDAERAVRAALAMQQRTAELAAVSGTEIRLRIGVNTGEVLVGAMRAGGEYTAMGDVVNTAQRIETMAEPGRVLVGLATYEATRAVIEYVPRGTVAVRGRDGPVAVWEARAVTAPPGHRPRRADAVFVGREHERALGEEALATSLGRRRALLVTLLGEAGMGKSRLAEELGRLARERHGSAVHEGRCLPYGEANVWWPLAEVVRSVCRVDAAAPAGDLRAALDALVSDHHEDAGPDGRGGGAGSWGPGDGAARMLPGLRHVLGDETALEGVEPGRAHEEARWAVLTLLEGVARRGPLVLLLSDVHWADGVIVDVLAGLLRRLERAPFAIVVTARGDVVPPELTATGANHVRCTLDPLGRAEAAALLDAVATASLDDAVREAVLDRSGGNPLFLEELGALLAGTPAGAEVPPGADRGDAAAAGRDGGGSGVLGEVPHTLRGIVSARLDALGPAERSVLEDAAVWGRAGKVDALVAMAGQVHGLGAATVRDAVRSLAARDVLVEDGPEWSFRSELVREVSYATITKADRARRHAGIGTFLLERFGPAADASDWVVDAAAHHLGAAAGLVHELREVRGVAAGMEGRAVAVLEEAGRRAELAHLPLVAEQRYSAALALALADDHRAARLRCLLGRAAARGVLRSLPEARRDLHEAEQLADALDDDGYRARALLVRGEVEQKEGALATAVATLDEAVRLGEELDDDEVVRRALRSLGLALIFRGDWQRAEEVISRTEARCRATDDRRGEAWALQHLAWISFVRGDADEADERLGTAAGTFRELGDFGGLNWANGLLAFLRFQQGRLAEARRLGEEVRAEAAARGDRWGEAMMLLLAGGVHLWSGRAGAAVVAAREAAEAFGAIGDGFGGGQATALLARALATSGAVAEAMGVAEAARRDLAATSPGEEHFGLIVGLANTYVHLGEAAAALSLLDERRPPEVAAANLGGVEELVARALAHLQSGRADVARSLLADEISAALTDGADGVRARSPFAGSAAVWAVAATGGSVAEVERLAASVDGSARATYLDRFSARLALALVCAGAEGDDALHRLDDIAGDLAGVEDAIAPAILDEARAALCAALGRPDRAAADAARDRWTALGVDGSGWRTAVRAVLEHRDGAEPASRSPAPA